MSSIRGGDDMDQRERDLIMREFRSGSFRVLITTDLLARGIDVQQDFPGHGHPLRACSLFLSLTYLSRSGVGNSVDAGGLLRLVVAVLLLVHRIASLRVPHAMKVAFCFSYLEAIGRVELDGVSVHRYLG